MPDGSRYIVRGAKMHCNHGSHPRQINLPVSHGSFVNDKPAMNEADSKAIQNIAYFGICNSGTNPNSENIYLVAENGATISGKRCCPNILANWTKTKEDTKVEGQSALTSESQLICAFEGLITFISDGQHEE